MTMGVEVVVSMTSEGGFFGSVPASIIKSIKFFCLDERRVRTSEIV